MGKKPNSKKQYPEFNIYYAGVSTLIIVNAVFNSNDISLLCLGAFGLFMFAANYLKRNSFYRYGFALASGAVFSITIIYSNADFYIIMPGVLSLAAGYAYLLPDIFSPSILGVALSYVTMQKFSLEITYGPIQRGIIAGALADAAAFTAIAYLMRQYAAQKNTLERTNELLKYNINHDSLTGFPNRNFFTKTLSEVIERKETASNFAVIFIDLDRFKIINDSLGHNNGDYLLIEVSKRLNSLLNGSCLLSRFGGDEFAILINDIKSIEDVTNLVESIKDKLKEPFTINGYELITTASIGVVFSNTNYSTIEEYLRYADIAMYEAKLHGKDRYEVFDNSAKEKISKKLILENDLKHAVERAELLLHYQPIVSLRTGKLLGFEALVRWKHPEFGMVSPMEFIPIAEETGLIIPIGRWILYEACRQSSLWQKQTSFTPALIINVNISPMQLTQSNIVEQIKGVLQETGLQPSCLNIEITESALIKDVRTSQKVLEQIRDLGVSIHIDDFGTGYSSLSYLQQFPFNVLKVDRSFVQQLNNNSKNLGVLKSIIMMAHELNMAVTGEGIETVEQAEWLKNLGCEHGQGYYFSKPMDKNAVEELLFAQAAAAADIIENQ